MLRYDIEKYRTLFPAIETGTVYLNHAATSPLSSRVVAAVDNYLLERSKTRIDNFGSLIRIARETKESIAKLINSTPDRIAFCDNTSNALNILASGLEWRQGDRIILNDIEFPANVYPFLNLRRRGVEVDFVKSRGGRVLPEDLEAAMTDRTRLLSISHVQFLSGYRADLELIGSLCRRHGILFSVDAIQSAGVVQIDVQRMMIDFLAAGGQKWLMAPQGIGFAFVSEPVQSMIDQAYLGWTSMRNFFGDFTSYRIEPDNTARRYENGTLNHIGILSLHETLSTLLEIGIDKIQEHVLDLGDRLTAELDKIGVPVFVDGPRAERAGIVSAKVNDPERAFARLSQSKVEVSLRQGWIRVSPHFYNTDNDITAFVDVLAAGA